MSTKALNVLHNRGKKKYKFLKKKDRLKLVEIGEFRQWTEPIRQEKLKKPNFTFFREALEYWSELDVSADFVSFRQKTNLYGYSLSLLLEKRRRILKLLLNRLRKRPKTIAFQSLCGCLLALVRDIRHRFVEYIPVTWKTLMNFIDFGNEEILSCILSTLNSLGKLLWEPLLKHFSKTWDLWKPLTIHKTKQIRALAARSFGYVLRKGAEQDFLTRNIATRLLQEVAFPTQYVNMKSQEMFQCRVDGVCECIMQMLFSPIGKQLSSKSDLVLKTFVEISLVGNEPFSGYAILQQMFVKILREIPESGSRWMWSHLVDVLQSSVHSKGERLSTDNLDCILLILGFCCETDRNHTISMDSIWNAFQFLIVDWTERGVELCGDIFSFCCLFYCFENFLSLLVKDATCLSQFWSHVMEKYVCCAYFPLFLERMIIISSQNQPRLVKKMLSKDSSYWEQFKADPENVFHWQVVLTLWKCYQHEELDIGIETIRQLFTAAIFRLSDHMANDSKLFMSLLDICCIVKDEIILREWESFLERKWNGPLDFSSKWLVARVCAKMLIAGCPLSSLFHQWLQELVFLEDIVDTQILRAVCISIESQGMLCKQLMDASLDIFNNLFKYIYFPCVKKRQAILKLLSTVGRLIEWKNYRVLELILAVEEVPKIATHVSESFLKTQRIIDLLRSKDLRVDENCSVMYILCLETLVWLQYELSPVQSNVYEIWKRLCALCPNTALTAVKQIFSRQLSWSSEGQLQSLEKNEDSSLVVCTQQPNAQSFLLHWMQSKNQKYLQSFLFYYENLSNCKAPELFKQEDKDCLDERMNFSSWHIHLLKLVETTLPESSPIAFYLLRSYFILSIHPKNARMDTSSVQLLERYLSLFLRYYEQQQQQQCSEGIEWKKENFVAIETRLVSLIGAGKGNIPQLALSCLVHCMQSYLSSYETWLNRLQDSKQLNDVYTHFYSALFDSDTNIPKTSESSLSIPKSHLFDMKKLVLHILIDGMLNVNAERDRLETSVLTLLSGFRKVDDIYLVWNVLWQPLLDCCSLGQIEDILEHMKDIPWNTKLSFNRRWEKIQKAIPLDHFSLHNREILLKWCIGCLQEDGDANSKEDRQRLRSVSLHLLSCIIESSLPLSELMTSTIFEWLTNCMFERYQPSDGQTPAWIVTLDKITCDETLTRRILQNEQLSRALVNMLVRFIQYAHQNEETLHYCMSIWKHLWNVAEKGNISFGWLQENSVRNEIWITLANNILRIWNTSTKPKKQRRQWIKKISLLDSLLEMILQYDTHERVTAEIDEQQLQSTFLKLFSLLLEIVGNGYYWKLASSLGEKSKALLVLYIERARMDGQRWLSHHIYSTLPFVLFQVKNNVQDQNVLDKMDKMLLELSNCLAKCLSDSWLNMVLQHLPDMLISTEDERRAQALELIISKLESLIETRSDDKKLDSDICPPPSCITLLLCSWVCFRNMILVDDLSIRNWSGRGLRVVGKCLLAQLENGTSSVRQSCVPPYCEDVIQHLVDTCSRLLLSNSSFGVQHQLMMALGSWVYSWHSMCSSQSNDGVTSISIPSLECFFPMLSDSSLSWFANMVHLQQHRRCRACIQVSRKVDVNPRFTDLLLKFVISWALERCLDSVTSANMDGVVERWYQVLRTLVDKSVHKIAWKDYKRYLERIFRKWTLMKDSTYPTSKKEWNMWIKVGEIFIAFLPKWMDTSDEEMKDSSRETVACHPCRTYMEERVIPFVARILTQLSYSSVVVSVGEKKYSSITPHFADLLIRCLHNVAEPKREKYVNEILLRYLTSQLRSKSQRQRNLARNCFCTLLKYWGTSYVRRISDATRASCQDGFRVYVFRYSIFCYAKCLAENNMTLQDAELIKEWMNIFHEEICSLVDDQENRIPYQECKEVSSSYIYEAFPVLAKIAQGEEKWELWRHMLTTCCEPSRVKNPSKKKHIVQKLFPSLVKSLTCVEYLDINEALWFVYSLMKERQPAEGKFLEESALVVLEFSLQLLHRLLKLLNKFDSTEYENVLKAFFPLVTQLFGTKNEFLCSYSLKIVQLLWKVTALPRSPSRWSNIFQYSLSLLSNATRLSSSDSWSNSALIHAAIQTLTIIISRIPENYSHHDKSWEQDYILPLMRIVQQLFSYVSGDWMLSLLKLIRGLVTCRLGFRAPEMFSLMNALSQVAIQSSDKRVVENIVTVWIDFILHYPIPESTFHEYVQYFTSNLQYPYSFGRQAAATILSNWLQASATSSIWKEKEISLFIAASAQKANEEDLECREAFSNLLTQIFSCMDEQRRLDTLQMVEEWSSKENKQELQLVAVGVVECLCDISDMRKAELALLLKASAKCLQSLSLQFSSWESSDVHFAFETLLSFFERMWKQRHSDTLVQDWFLDIYECMRKYDLFGTTRLLSARRKLDSLINSFLSSLETRNVAMERKVRHLILSDTENTLLNCCVDHLSWDPLTEDSGRCISENIRRLLDWIEKYRCHNNNKNENVSQSTIEATSFDCLQKITKIASSPCSPTDTCGTLRRQVAAELVRDRLKLNDSLWAMNVSSQESYARPILKMLLRGWKDFGEAVDRKRKAGQVTTSQEEGIQLVLQDIEYWLSYRMSSIEYHTLLNTMREEYIQRRKVRKMNKN